MTKEERIIVSAYTGFLMCDFADVHEYIEKKLGRKVWTHELADKKTWEEIKEKTKEDFMEVCKADETPEIVKVVRCKDCKHREAVERKAKGNVVERYFLCELDDDVAPDNWFCAGGERREDSEESR